MKGCAPVRRLGFCCAVAGALLAAGSVPNPAAASTGVGICRNQIAINSLVIAGPDVIVGSGFGPGNCRQDPADHGDKIEPRVIVSSSDVYVDVSLANNWR